MTDVEIRANEAAVLLGNAMFNEALDTLRREAIERAIASKPDAITEREYAWLTARCVDSLRLYFETVRDEGRFAANRAVRMP